MKERDTREDVHNPVEAEYLESRGSGSQLSEWAEWARQRARAPGALVLTFGLGAALGFGLKDTTSDMAAPDKPSSKEWSVDLLEYPPSSVHVPKRVAKLHESQPVEVHCAWFGYLMYAGEDEKPGFKPTWYNVSTEDRSEDRGAVLALHVEAYGPIPSCEQVKPPFRAIEPGNPVLDPDITAAVPGVIVENVNTPSNG